MEVLLIGFDVRKIARKIGKIFPPRIPQENGEAQLRLYRGQPEFVDDLGITLQFPHGTRIFFLSPPHLEEGAAALTSISFVAKREDRKGDVVLAQQDEARYLREGDKEFLQFPDGLKIKLGQVADVYRRIRYEIPA
jgi:hypothetical protein